MITVNKYEAKHLLKLLSQDGMAYLRSYLTSDYIFELEKSEFSYTGLVEDKPIICAGLVEKDRGRAEAWAVIDRNSRPYFLAIHNTVRRFLQLCPMRRIEAVVECRFEAGHRWAKSLGFELEAERMRGYHSDGKDYSLYARVQ